MHATALHSPIVPTFDAFSRVHWHVRGIWSHGLRVDRTPRPALPAAGADGEPTAVRDRYVDRALALLHERAAEPWTVATLARQVGLSRSALHERFVAWVGQPPKRYLADWRVRLGAARLRDGDDKVACIALEVGYESEAAFARAFKRLMGKPPAAWRRDARRASHSADAGAMHMNTSRRQSRDALHSARYPARPH